MTLKSIVTALGGDLYAGGLQANVPGPGHSRQDRSVSLLLRGDRVVIHSFGAADWQAVRDDLCRRALITRDGRLIATAGPSSHAGPSSPKPDSAERRRVARRLWQDASPLGGAQASLAYLERRAIAHAMAVTNLRHHPAAPVSVYRDSGPTRPALVARIAAPTGELTAVELTYLTPIGRPVLDLALPRKTVGLVPPGSAVRLARPRETLLVGEGVLTTLSAMAWFGLPGWALMAARNLAAWTPPVGIRRVIIAGDRGAPGETAAETLRRRLQRLGTTAEIRLPDPGFADWNDVAVADRRREEGRPRAPVRRG